MHGIHMAHICMVMALSAGAVTSYLVPAAPLQVVSPQTMGAVAHYGPPVAMQPCYLGADGPLPMPPLQHPCARTHLPATSTAYLQIMPPPVRLVHSPGRCISQDSTCSTYGIIYPLSNLKPVPRHLLTPLTCRADAGAFVYRQAFQQHQQQYQQHSACGTPTAAALTPQASVGSGLPCLTPVRLPDGCPVAAPPSVSGSDRSPRASGPILIEIAGVLSRAAGLAEPLPPEVTDMTPPC